jgi:hypothetical protein
MDLNWDRETLTMEEAIRRAIYRKMNGEPSGQPRMHANGREVRNKAAPVLTVRRRTIADAQAVAS